MKICQEVLWRLFLFGLLFYYYICSQLLHVCFNLLYVHINIIIIIVLNNSIVKKTFRLHCPNNCGHSYVGDGQRKSLKRHLQYECGVEPQFTCYICSKQFSHKSNLKIHLANIHQELM